MSDKELLELAAKAAGIEFWEVGGNLFVAHGETWNPLTDDGDALRLAVKLHTNLLFEQELSGWDVEAGSCGENCKPDPYAATRRAIVRATAAIGKDMP